MANNYTHENGIDSHRYYHLSKSDKLSILNPDVPNNYMTKNGYEDSKTKRVSFAPSINQCLMGLSRNVNDEEFYVYIPYNIDLNKLKSPSVNQVPDVLITGEVWSKEPIRVKCIGKIIAKETKEEKSHTFEYGSNNTAELYDWDYKVLVNEDAKEIYDSNSNTIDTHVLSDKDQEDLFELPDMEVYKPDVKTLLDNTPLDHIFCSSDWHYFKNHYKKEANYVNTAKITTWCRQNLKPTDVFMYLGDISFRYANKEDQKKSQEMLKSINCRKILILGNHDKMLGDDYYTACGFDYVMEELTWQNYIFTHRPINMSTYPANMINIHGHIHNIRKYNTTDGKRNVNVYPMWYDNKPVTVKYLVDHFDELIKDNEWNFNYGYSEGYKLNPLNKKSLLEAQYNRSNKPNVYYSSRIDSETIAYMVFLFKDKIGVNPAIKVHFGEKGNKNFLNPRLLKDLVKETNGSLVDSNTAYDGSARLDTLNHLNIAREHGFGFAHIDILDAEEQDLMISVPKRYVIERELNDIDAGKKKAYESFVYPGRHLSEIALGSHIKNYDSLIVYSHFKGHSMAGYGGALKNIGMGIPSGKLGKKQIHGQAFKSGPLFIERLVEAGSAVQSLFDDKIVYVNVLKNMSTMCDCDADAPKATIPDIGVLVSDDIVAIEQASLDFIRNIPKNKDLIEQIGKRGGFHQIEYMQALNMGSTSYVLRNLDDSKITLEETILSENYITDSKDIYYNRDKFESGKINLCFITGLSGSGKSTMASGMKSEDIIHSDMDNVVFNCNFSDPELKSCGELIYAFFSTPIGKKYRLSKGNIKAVNNYYRASITNEFVKFAKQYAASHKNKKFIVEGVYLFWMVKPDVIKDYAVYIKGTSAVKSAYHAVKRDTTEKGISTGINTLKTKIKGMAYNKNNLDRFRKYYEKLMEKESDNPVKQSHIYAVKEMSRSQLPDSAFGIPEDRKFPLDSANRVKSAIHLFGHAEESKKKNLALRIRRAAKKYNISIPENTQCYKYLTEGAMASIIPDNVDTIIFDMGSVLVDADFIGALQRNQDIPEEFIEDINDVIINEFFYKSSDIKRKIQQFDIPQAKKYYLEVAPEHIKPYVDSVFDCFAPAMFAYDYTMELLDKLAAKDYRLFYLSNWDKYSYQLEKDFFKPLLDKFEDGMFSFECGSMLKPDAEFYEELLSEFSIDRNKAIFFDDKQENIDAALSVGLNAVLFNHNETPKLFFNTSMDISNTPKDTLLISSQDEGFTNIPINTLTWWYISDKRENNTSIEEEQFYKSLDLAIEIRAKDLDKVGTFTDDYPSVEQYVYTSDKALSLDPHDGVPKAVLVGKILLYANGAYEWIIQYPLNIHNRIISSISEAMALSSVNPVIGFNRPFIIKRGLVNRRYKDDSEYVFMQDINSDKYLAVEDNELVVKECNNIDILEAYEFIGNKSYIDRLAKRYSENASVDNIYSAITDKVLYTEDQIDFDPMFKKVDFELLEQKALSELATLRDQIIASMGYRVVAAAVKESTVIKYPEFISKYNRFNDIILREDFDGIYAYCTSTKKRCASVASSTLITEAMIKSII